MWLSLIWANVKSARAPPDIACPTGRDDTLPPQALSTTAVPAHAMQPRKPRRSIPSSSLVGSMAWLPDDDGAVHERVDRADVAERALVVKHDAVALAGVERR